MSTTRISFSCSAQQLKTKVGVGWCLRLSGAHGWSLLALAWMTCFLSADAIRFHARKRVPAEGNTNQWKSVESEIVWEGARTAVVVCDMWDKHWCPDATERVGELAPVMNRVIAAARQRGALIIHCPSDTMDFYKDHEGRKLAQSAPKVETQIPLKGWCNLVMEKEAPLPIDDSDGGCDGCPDCPSYRAWSRQHPAIEIQPGDAITDSAEAFYLMRQRGVTNVVVMGVHENMCVLGRPFSIRQMVAQGQNVVLMRDMTDSMYHHRQRPYVSHFAGTDLVCEHIEKYWCPSVTSVDLIGGAPFRFREDRRKRVVVITGENEYSTEQTLGDFAINELAWRGIDVDFVAASAKEGDPEFKNVDAIAKADLVLISVRRRTPSRAMMGLLRAHVEAGKAVAGIRTASHAFDAKPISDAYEAWPGFDDEVLGMDYQGHYNNKPPAAAHTVVDVVRTNSSHVALTGVKASGLRVTSHLYKYRKPGPGVVTLLQGHVEGRTEIEPVAWVNEVGGGRVFYTSLGNVEDFAVPAFRRLLLNGLLWSLRLPLPPAEPSAALPRAEAVGKPAVNPPSVAVAAPRISNPLDLPQETDSPPLSPEASAGRFHVAEDLVWEQVLAEPLIAQPVFLNFDERGRLWVVEYRQYPLPAGLKLISHDSVWRNVYDKVPPPPPRHFRGADRISIHEDTDGDGRYDKHSVFVDGLNIATAVEHGRGGVWVLNPPYLLFYRDANRDDVPDGEPEVRLTGFGLEDTHAVANSLRWGPDGWLYGAQGSTVTANILVHGADGAPLNTRPIYSQGQNIWRYHPERRIYEVFSEGGGNAFGCEIDSQGRVFSGHNGGDTRGFHYVQGAYLQKGFEKHGPLSNPYAFGYFPAMQHGSVPRFTHNFIIYDSGALPERYAGRLFGIEPIQGRIVESEIEPVGSTFRTRDVSRVVTSDDRWFRPVDIKLGPDGAIYVCDWYDQQVNHYRNHEGKMDAKNGRVYRLRGKTGVRTASEDRARISSSELLNRLRSTNRWERQTAQRLLADRGDRGMVVHLKESLHRSEGQAALECLWALSQAGGLDEGELLSAMGHSDAPVRLWAVRLAGDARAVSPAVANRMAQLAGGESNLEVRIQLAASAKRLEVGFAMPVIRGLLTHEVDAEDARMPLMVWWAIEGHCERSSADVLTLLREAKLWQQPMVQQHLLERLARRFASTGVRRDLLTCAGLFEQAPDEECRRRLAAGFEQAYRGRSMGGLPSELIQAMSRPGARSLAVRVRLGEAEAVTQALGVVRDETASKDRRVELMSILGELKRQEALPVLLQVLRGAAGDQGVRRAAILALQSFDAAEVGAGIVSVYPVLKGDTARTAEAVLASRSAWSKQFLKAIAGQWAGWSGKPFVTPASVSPSTVRKVKQDRDVEVVRMAQQLWPDLGSPTTAEMESRIRSYAGLIRSGEGDPYAGRALFQNVCSGCHKLFGQGGEVGPDLTVYKRDDVESMLLSIVNPSAEVREGYESYSVETKDDRSLSGFLVEKGDEVVTLRGLDGQNTVINRREIAEIKPANGSLMPGGLLEALKDQQVRDLFAYLRSTQPLVGESTRR